MGRLINRRAAVIKLLLAVAVAFVLMLPSPSWARWFLTSHRQQYADERSPWNWTVWRVFKDRKDCEDYLDERTTAENGAGILGSWLCISDKGRRWGGNLPRWIHVDDATGYNTTIYKIFPDKERCEILRNQIRANSGSLTGLCVLLDDPELYFNVPDKTNWQLLMPPVLGGIDAPIKHWESYKIYEHSDDCKSALAANQQLKRVGAKCVPINCNSEATDDPCLH